MAERTYPDWIWHNGAIKPWKDATVHVMAHALHYGSAVFEGIRSYKTPHGTVIFRLADHMKRLFNSAKIYDIAMPYTREQLTDACRAVLKANKLEQAYLRPIVFRGLGGFGLSAETPTDVAIAAWPMGPYLGPEALEGGITACVSSWQRIARASTGLLSEGAGENLFLVMDDALHTAPVSAALLNGITRDTLMTLARVHGLGVVERDLPREYLYLADEVFMCGTAAEITPI